MFFRSRFGYGIPYAGAGFARFLSFLCPLLLVLLVLMRAFLPVPNAIRYMWTGQIILLSVSAAFALLLLLIGPWQNRLAGVWLGIVVGVLFYFMNPLLGWAAQLSRHV